LPRAVEKKRKRRFSKPPVEKNKPRGFPAARLAIRLCLEGKRPVYSRLGLNFLDHLGGAGGKTLRGRLGNVKNSFFALAHAPCPSARRKTRPNEFTKISPAIPKVGGLGPGGLRTR